MPCKFFTKEEIAILSKNPYVYKVTLVLCQDFGQIKMRHFINLQVQSAFEYSNIVLRNHQVTYNHNDYDFEPCCKRVQCIQKQDYMPDSNPESGNGLAIPA